HQGGPQLLGPGRAGGVVGSRPTGDRHPNGWALILTVRRAIVPPPDPREIGCSGQATANHTMTVASQNDPAGTSADCLEMLGHTRLCVTALAYYSLTTSVVVLGALFGHKYLERPTNHAERGPVLTAFLTWDGHWYRSIATDGYSYDPDQVSTVAFFPAYPMLSGLLARLTRVRIETALVICPHLCLAASFVLALYYLRARFPKAPTELGRYTLIALGLFPTSLFFRTAYSESLFLLLTILFLYAMVRTWPFVLIATIAGMATATRPVGVAFLVPLTIHLWHRSVGVRQFVRNVALLTPLACWGLAVYMIYQSIAFADPLAFVRSQA